MSDSSSTLFTEDSKYVRYAPVTFLFTGLLIIITALCTLMRYDFDKRNITLNLKDATVDTSYSVIWNTTDTVSLVRLGDNIDVTLSVPVKGSSVIKGELSNIVWSFGIAFMSLIIAIIGWVGVTNVKHILDLKRDIEGFLEISRIKTDKEMLRVSNTIDLIDSRVKKIEEISDIDQVLLSLRSLSTTMNNRIKDNAAFTSINPGMDLLVRLNSVQRLTQVEGVRLHYRYFQNILDETLRLEQPAFDSLSKEDQNRWSAFIRDLRELAKPL